MQDKREPQKISKCCKAKIEVHGDAEYLIFICKKCKKECSFKVINHWILQYRTAKKNKKLEEWNKLTWD